MTLTLGILGVAGVAVAAQRPAGMPCSDPPLWQQMLDANAKGGFMMQEHADQMQKKGNTPAPGK